MTGFLIGFSVVLVVVTFFYLKYSDKTRKDKMTNDEIPVKKVDFESDCII